MGMNRRGKTMDSHSSHTQKPSDAFSRVCRNPTAVFALALLLLDVVLTFFIIAYVPYTKIDWDAYMSQDIKRESWVLTDEGKLYAASGSPEVQLLLAIPPEGIPRDALQKKVDPSVYKIGFQQAMKNKWVELEKQSQLVHRKYVCLPGSCKITPRILGKL